MVVVKIVFFSFLIIIYTTQLLGTGVFMALGIHLGRHHMGGNICWHTLLVHRTHSYIYLTFFSPYYPLDVMGKKEKFMGNEG
jgi:hypothetical protein